MTTLLALTIFALTLLPACFGEWWLTVVLMIGLGLWAVEDVTGRSGR